MAVKIRLARFGKTHAPVYRIVAADSRRSRDGKILEDLGTYNPLRHELVRLEQDRIEYWVSQGAIVSDAVKRIQKRASEKKAAA